MRIGLQTWGTEGDVRPFFSLACALQARGHEVRVVYTSVEGRDFGELAKSLGIDARSVGANYFIENQVQIAAAARANMLLGSPLRQIEALLAGLMDPVADEMLAAGEDLAKDSDVVVGHFITHPSATAAERHDKPFIVLAMQPVLPSKHYAPVGMPDLGRLVNPFLWMILARVLESVLRDRVNRTRARCGLAPIRGLQRRALEETLLILVSVSPALFPRPRDWVKHFDLSGFLPLPDGKESWAPDADLRAFLDRGPAPVFLSFGSMFQLDAEVTGDCVRIFVEALALAGARGIIQAPADIIARAPQADTVAYITRAPHAQLFPLCSTIVHHGGAGTTQSALLAGRTSVVVPHAADQFFWGELLFARGVGSRPLKRSALHSKALAGRIRWSLANPDCAVRAGVLGEAIRLERGPERAAIAIEDAMANRRS